MKRSETDYTGAWFQTLIYLLALFIRWPFRAARDRWR